MKDKEKGTAETSLDFTQDQFRSIMDRSTEMIIEHYEQVEDIKRVSSSSSV